MLLLLCLLQLLPFSMLLLLWRRCCIRHGGKEALKDDYASTQNAYTPGSLRLLL